MKISQVIGLISTCFLLILGGQVYWLKHSHDIIENQFDQKVSMALCSAVSEVGNCTNESCTLKDEGYLANTSNGLAFSTDCLQMQAIDKGRLNPAIARALDFYDLPPTFEIDLVQACDLDCDPTSPYCCAVGSYDAGNNQYIHIRFPERRAYVFDKMWLMLLSSSLILLFILFVFILTIRSLLTQRRISQFNIDFFNNMAHEFRTPIANMRLAIGRIKQKHASLEDDPYLRILAGENFRLNQNVERVLSLAKLDNGQYELRKEQVDIRKLLDVVIKDLSLVIREAGAQIRIDPGMEQFRVWADPLHLRHAFRNLIDNAIKYCDKIPHIEIGMQAVDKGVMLVFKDNGVGIDEKQKELVFDRFTRLGAEKHVKGYGLGLSYVKMIVDLHQGKVRLFSQSGKGSKFELFFPQLVS